MAMAIGKYEPSQIYPILLPISATVGTRGRDEFNSEKSLTNGPSVGKHCKLSVPGI